MASSSSIDQKEKRAPNPLWAVWEHHTALQIPGTSFTLIGFSIAALRTNFYIKELGVMLDAGISANISPDHILITHGHSDHTANLPYHLYSNKPDSRIQVYVPSSRKQGFEDIIGASYSLTTDREFDQKQCAGCDLIGVTPGTRLPISLKNRPHLLEIIACDHSVPCVGYGLSEKRKKLKSEYTGLTSKEIGALRKEGKEVTVETDMPFFLFLGDTSSRILQDPLLEQYPVIMIECTFLLPEEQKQADETKHMHWSELKPYVTAHPHITFILYHFSQRYTSKQISEHFEAQNIKNIIPWISQF